MISRKSLFIVLLLLVIVKLQSQTILVYDQQTGEPISNVFIFNNDNTATGLSNELGYARLEGFSASDDIHFQHPSYNDSLLDLLLIENMRFKVPLNQKLINLEEVVVSANRWETKTYEIPNNIDVIKSKNIIFENPATSADMLTSTGGVFIQKSQLGGGSPMIRGFAANQLLFM